MHLDVFDRKIVDVLRARGGPVTLAQLVRDAEFARSTAVVQVERLGTGELALKEKKLSACRGRPEFLYSLADNPTPEAAPAPSIVALEFSRLKKACRYEKGGYCKPARDACTTQNCSLTIKPNKIY